jgi:uncharacterized phage protein gp47/JayE
MPFIRPTVQTIYDRLITGIESRLTGGTALLRRAVLRVLAKVFSGAVHLLYGYVEYISTQLFVDQAEDSWLDRHGFVWGIIRKAASYASGSVTFNGTNGTLIEAGTVVQTEVGVEYETTTDTTISGTSASADIVAVEAGASGNFSGSQVQLVSPISGIDSVVWINGGVITGGVDTESNDDYRARILERIQYPPMGGTAKDYEIWAKSSEIPVTNGTVKKAWCFPLASGPGTVDVVIIAEGSSPIASSGLITDVQSYINTVKPVTADVTVETVDDKTVEMQISIPVIDSTITSAIISNLQDLIEQSAAPGSNWLISQIRDAIMDSGVENYEIDWITVDGVSVAVDDIVLTGYQYPILGSIAFAAL